ncbi:MAG: oligosaccharide flippase family protein [Candidatus Nezhaarchaeales archaeon]
MSQNSASLERRLLLTAEEVASGTFHLFWGGGLATLLSAICAMIVARLLGPELYGIYALAFVVPGFLMLFTDYGVSPALTRFVALHESRGEGGMVLRVLKVGLPFSFTVSIAVFIVGIMFVEQLTTTLTNRPEIAYLTAMCMILILVQPISAAASNALLGFRDMRACAAIDVVRQALRALLSPLLVILGFSVAGAITGYVVAFSIGALTSLILLYRHYRRIREGSVRAGEVQGDSFQRVLPRMISYGLPLYLSGILYGLTSTLQGVVLAYSVTNELIGNFRAALSATIPITLISSPVATSLFPAFSKLGLEGEAKTLFKFSVKYTAALIIPAAMFVAFMSRDLVFLLYGESYVHAPLYLAIYSVTYLLAGLGSTVLGSFFSGIGASSINFKAAVLYTIVFASLSAPLTFTFKVEGMLMAIIVAATASTIYSLVIAVRRYGLMPDLKASAKIYLASLLASIIIMPFSLHQLLPSIANLVFSALIYLIAYLTIAPLLQVLIKSELEGLTRIFSTITIIAPIVKVISKYENMVLKLVSSASN